MFILDTLEGYRFSPRPDNAESRYFVSVSRYRAARLLIRPRSNQVADIARTPEERNKLSLNENVVPRAFTLAAATPRDRFCRRARDTTTATHTLYL